MTFGNRVRLALILSIYVGLTIYATVMRDVVGMIAFSVCVVAYGGSATFLWIQRRRDSRDGCGNNTEETDYVGKD